MPCTLPFVYLILMPHKHPQTLSSTPVPKLIPKQVVHMLVQPSGTRYPVLRHLYTWFKYFRSIPLLFFPNIKSKLPKLFISDIPHQLHNSYLSFWRTANVKQPTSIHTFLDLSYLRHPTSILSQLPFFLTPRNRKTTHISTYASLSSAIPLTLTIPTLLLT